MADLSKISINGTTYNIKDEEARSAIGDKIGATELEEAVNLAIEAAKDSGGLNGDDGATFTPSVSADGVLSWTNNKGLENPPAVSIKGPKGDSADGTSSSAPEHIIKSADAVVDKVLAAQNANTMTIVFTSDAHYPSGLSFISELSYALSRIINNVYIDCAADLGDVVWGGTNNPDENTAQEMRDFNYHIAPVFNGKKWMRLCGNHDPHNSTLEDRSSYIHGFNKELNAVFGDENQGYFYLDIPRHKTRFIAVNTTEWDDGDGADKSNIKMSSKQYEWICETLESMKGKTGWNIVFLSHHPLDFTDNGASGQRVIDIIKAYDSGNTFKVSEKTYDFAGERAPILVSFHGHLHNFTVHTYEGTKIPRICIPHACRGRTNEYGRSSSKTDIFKLRFGDLDDYGKAITPYRVSEKSEDYYDDGNRQDDVTAFNVVVLDVVNKSAKCYNFGAGYDREVSLIRETGAIYTIEQNLLSGMSSVNSRPCWSRQKAYRNTLIGGVDSSNVVVTIGGKDVTSDVYTINEDDGVGEIYIEDITGDVVISATASDGESYSIIRHLTNVTIDDGGASNIADGAEYRATVNANDGYTLSSVIVQMNEDDVTDSVYSEENGEIYIGSVSGNIIITATAVISGGGSTETYTVEHSLGDNVNATTDDATVGAGSSFTSILSADGEYAVGVVTVTMRGEDITSSATSRLGASEVQVNIPSVTGDVEIVATAVRNLVVTSLGHDQQVYNTVGYANDTYISSSFSGGDYGTIGNKPGYVTTGYMPTSETFYLYGAEWDNTTSTRLATAQYSTTESKYTHGFLYYGNGTDVTVSTKSQDESTELPGGWYRLVINKQTQSYVRMCLHGTGTNLIVTDTAPIV